MRIVEVFYIICWTVTQIIEMRWMLIKWMSNHWQGTSWIWTKESTHRNAKKHIFRQSREHKRLFQKQYIKQKQNNRIWDRSRIPATLHWNSWSISDFNILWCILYWRLNKFKVFDVVAEFSMYHDWTHASQCLDFKYLLDKESIDLKVLASYIKFRCKASPLLQWI